MDADPAWIALSGPGASVRILPNGPPELGWPALLRLETGLLSIERQYELGDVQAFSDQISNMHRTMTGTAQLSDWEGEFKLGLEMGTRGRVAVQVSLQEFGASECEVKVKFPIDQSYLPPFATSMRAGFKKQNWQ